MMLKAATWDRQQYELIDFGGGRKLERFGKYILDRPSPAAEPFSTAGKVDWTQADARIDSRGEIEHGSEAQFGQVTWQVRFDRLIFNLKLTPFGHVGLFPEQAENWNWLGATVAGEEFGKGSSDSVDTQLNGATALNLFAYTGGTTLALALSGMQVVHVDASTPAVTWARSNAQASGLQDHPIRWIVEDARKFVARELRRGNRYDIVVMDPPTYGHGPSGKPWMLAEHLPELIEGTISLLRQDEKSRLLITAHSECPSSRDIVQMIGNKREPKTINDGRLQLVDSSHRRLDAGFFVRAKF